MGFLRQTWTLCEKTLTVVFLRHWLGTLIRAFFAPIIFIFIIAYSKNLFVPPSAFGIGDPTPLRSFGDALALSAGGRDRLVLVNNGFTDGSIAQVVETLAQPARDRGMEVNIVELETDLLTLCKSTVRGVSRCFAAVTFTSSPDQGPDSFWNYSIRADGSFGQRIFVDSATNDAQIYVLPLQHAVDDAIAAVDGDSLPDDVQQFVYTDETPTGRERDINRRYMQALIDILAIAYFIGFVGVCFQLTGEMAKERELGISQLVEAMMPNRRRWVPQAARLLALHLSYDILYLPGWIFMAAIVATLNYSFSNAGVIVGYFILAGFALSGWSIAIGSLFRKAQLSGITAVIVSNILGVIVQLQRPTGDVAIALLIFFFPPMNFVLFIIYVADWQKEGLAVDLSQGPPTQPWSTPGYLFFLFSLIQAVVYPMVGAFLERQLYGTASKARKLQYDQGDAREPLSVSGLTKIYRPSWFARHIGSIFTKSPKRDVAAVDNVDMTALRGQIVVLLGANGSGKTTTLEMLAGLQAPTSGTISLDATGGIGLCPQHNVLWDELTVYEHVRIFNRLKATEIDSSATMKELVAACDLEPKANARSKSLSGGQKRKCQLAMMLTGGSKLCLLDEVSSGLDPLSRRKIWDILLAERGKRTMIMTTHFLDEADLCSDDITILSKGKLVAVGSAVALKHRLGGGYRVRVYHEDHRPLPSELEDTEKQKLHDQTVYQLGTSAAAAKFVVELEKAGVRDYQVSGPTIEDVFLKLADEIKVDPDKGDSDSSDGKGLQLVTGKNPSFAGQTLVLFRKRLTILRRNPWPYLVSLVLPIITAGMTTFYIVDFDQLSCTPSALSRSFSRSISLPFYLATGQADIPAGPPDQLSLDFLNGLFPSGLLESSINDVNGLNGLTDYIAANFSSALPGGIALGNTPTFAWRGNYQLAYSVATQNLLDASLLETPIVTTYEPFDVAFSPSAGDSLNFVLYFGLAMGVYPAFFALYINLERLRSVRALHYSNGVRVGPLWLAHILFDFVIVLAVSIASIVIFISVQDFWYGPGYLFLCFLLYGLSATLMAYVISLFTTSQLATFAFTAGGQCSFFLMYFIAFMSVITYAPAAEVDSYTSIVHYTMGLFLPAGNLLRALLLTFNQFSVTCRGGELAPYPGAFTVYGSVILYFILQAVVLFATLIWYDSGWRPPLLSRRKKERALDAEEKESEGIDADVASETKRVDASQDELRVLHVTKAFGSNTAVQDVTFGVPKGEVFALLGPNGAGKSTTIALIRGDSPPTDRNGDILVEGTSIVSHRAAARVHLGVCPQFDAMDQMTAIEHLRFYARVRGVPDVEHNVEQVLHAVGLSPYKSRKAAKLSGGNKRKLSLGIALIGNPSVLLLDEPSSGMDAASKRVMWRTLSSVSSGRSTVLTTHSMEEADALADRAGIMACRMLALGTADQLRKKHGDAYHVHLVHRDAPYTTAADMAALKTWIAQTFPRASTEDRAFHGQLRFSLPTDRSADPTTGTGISALFAQLEDNKEALGLEYYSVSQATLDQVFLSIVGKHNVQEEDHARRRGSTKPGPMVKVYRAFGVDSWKGLLF